MQHRPFRRRKLHRRALALLVFTPLIGSLVAAQTTGSAASSTTSTSPATAAGATKSTAKSSPSKSTDTTAAPQPTVTELAPIVVTAPTRLAQPVESTASTTTVITQQELFDQHYGSVPDALSSVAGLSVVTSGNPGAETSLFIHGLDARDALVTIDGRRQPPGLSGFDDNFTNLTLDNVEQIEVVRTPISSSQGPSAMGGVVNVVTQSGKGVAPEGNVGFEAGSFDTFHESASSRGQIGNFDYALSLSRQDSVYPALSPGTPADFAPGFPGQADQYRNTGYRGNFGYQLTPDIYLDLHTTYNNAYTSSPGLEEFPDPTANLTTEQWMISPEITAKVTDFYTSKFYYSRNQFRIDSQDPFLTQEEISFGEIPQNTQTRTQIDTDSIDWQNDFQLARNWTLSAGVQGDDSGYDIFDDTLGRKTLTGDRRNIGGFISSQWQPLEGLNVFSSGRFDEYNQFAGAFSWRQGVSYTVAPTKTQLHASVSRAFTPPPLQDVAYPAGINTPNLKPETDLGWEAGVEQPLADGKVTPSVTYFHNDLHNYIEAYAPTYVPFNVPDATTEGVEVGLDLQPIDTVKLHLGYTYLNAVNDTDQSRLLRRPRNQLTFTGTWKPIPKLTLSVGGLWVVDRRDIDPTSTEPFPTTLSPNYTVVKAPDYFVLRASATYEINDNVTIWVRGDNLTDASYQPALGYYAPSIGGYGGVQFSF
jgi:vitamin B12 transporter